MTDRNKNAGTTKIEKRGGYAGSAPKTQPKAPTSSGANQSQNKKP